MEVELVCKTSGLWHKTVRICHPPPSQISVGTTRNGLVSVHKVEANKRLSVHLLARLGSWCQWQHSGLLTRQISVQPRVDPPHKRYIVLTHGHWRALNSPDCFDHRVLLVTDLAIDPFVARQKCSCKLVGAIPS